MRAVNIVVFHLLFGAENSCGEYNDVYHFCARIIDQIGNRKYEFQDWGFDFSHAVNKVRRDYIMFCDRLLKDLVRKSTRGKSEMENWENEFLLDWKKDDIAFVCYLAEENDGEFNSSTYKKVIFPKSTSALAECCFFLDYKKPDYL